MTDSNRAFHGLVLLTFALMAVIILLSAHMRLSGAGLGCSDWPACYGRNLAGVAPPHPGWINTTHRIAASTMGFTVLAIASLAWRRRRVAPGDFPPALALLGLTAFLAALGKLTHDAHLPAVALGNLLGGFGMLALLWRLHLGYTPQYAASSRLRWQVSLGLGLLVAQIALGGMVSANFAALSCTGPSGCDSWLQHASSGAFNPFRVLNVAQGSSFIPGEAQQTLHMTHRFSALLVFCYLAWLGVCLIRENLRRSGMLLIAALMLQVALGIGIVAYRLPLFLVLMHNATAAFLLLILVTLGYRLRRR
ncbi:MAG: COX15/CtaA family protein [Betaproteobacteria bacterium]|nr:COX15/CtaA family protein [Betaproteobacteria bacterium]